MRRRLALLLVLPALALPGCGEEEAANALDEALGYLPPNAPFVAAIDTDIEGSQYEALGKIVRKFPFGGQIEESLERQLEQDGNVDFDRDVKPLLGNPFVVGAVDARSFVAEGDTDDFVGAIQAEDSGKLEDLIDREKPEEVGEKEGATLYEDDDGDTFAIKDDVLVVAGSRELLEQALERREGDDRLDEEAFDEALEGLPEDALVRSFFDVEQLVRVDPDTRDARKVKWVDALRTFGLTASVEEDAIAIDFDMKTDRAGLDADDVPLAAGEESPRVVRHESELGVGLRDPGQIVEFGLAAGRAVDPSSVEAGERRIERQLGIDLDEDVIRQLAGDVSVNVAVDGDFGVRAELRDPRAFEQTLEKVADRLPRVAPELGRGSVRIVKPKRGEDFYEVTGPGDDRVVLGVVRGALVVSNDSRRAGRLAAETPSEVPGAEGSLVIRADAERLVDAALQRLGPQLGLGGVLGGQLFTGPLGDITGSVTTSTGGLKGSLKLEIE